jgi:hypothetical protein
MEMTMKGMESIVKKEVMTLIGMIAEIDGEITESKNMSIPDGYFETRLYFVQFRLMSLLSKIKEGK